MDFPVVAPTLEPIALADAKLHLRQDSNAEDTTIALYLASARQLAETFCRRSFVRQARRWVADQFPWTIELPNGPLRAVQSIKYVDVAGSLQTVDSSIYLVDAISRVPRITPAWGKVWPFPLTQMNAVQLDYTAGYAAPISAVDTTTDRLTVPGHDQADAAPVQLYNSGGALPAPLLEGVTYYVKLIDANTMQLSLTSGGAAIDLTSTGTGNSFVGVVPQAVRNAILLILGAIFENRENAGDMNPLDMPSAASSLLFPYRLPQYMGGCSP